MTDDIINSPQAARDPADGDGLIDLDGAGPADLETAKTEVARLAGLEQLAYQLARNEAAKRLGIRAGVLDAAVAQERGDDAGTDAGPPGLKLEPPEPWPDAVAGAALADEIVDVLRRYIAADIAALDASALWIIFSHAHNCFAISPLLAITSPTPACGKSTLLSLIGAMVPKPLAASNITTSSLFRSVEKWQPTLVLDEGDTFLHDNPDLRGVLNSGHLRASAFVVRSVGDDHEPRQFRTWCPKAVALIGRPPPTLASRAIHIRLQRATAAEAPEPLRIDRLDMTRQLRQAARWSADHFDLLQAADPQVPATLHGRDADNWRPLLSIADAVGDRWPQRARQAAQTLTCGDEGQTRH